MQKNIFNRPQLRNVAAAAGALMALGCSAPEHGDSGALGDLTQPSLCGSDDMQDVEAYDGSLGPSLSFVAEHERPVGNLKWVSDLAARYTNPGNVSGARWCTGTLISEDLMLTAGHCFDVDGGGWWPRQNGTSTPISSATGATEMQVDFNYQNAPNGTPRTRQTFDIVELVENRVGGLDFAVVRLSGSPGTTYGRNIPSPFPLALNDDITIVQHPAGMPKQIHAGAISSINTSTGGVRYLVADTLGGSSGSGVLHELTGFISAVHTQGGCDFAGGNFGISIERIVAESSVLRTLSFDAAKLVSIW